MTKQFWVGDCFIDLSRNQLTQKDKTQTLPPKALAVLAYLVQKQGSVVSHDDLLKHVWPNTVVSPNSLQKCIAQLRKAFSDGGKEGIIIRTHAKQGYSLEATVRWAGDNITQDQSKKEDFQKGIKFLLPALVIGIALFGLLAYNKSQQSPNSLSVKSIRSITATDDKEFDASYTPDGEYILFHRYLDKQCANRIWAKHIKTGREILLTKEWGAYGSHSISADGKKLIFLASEPCHEPVTQLLCYDLVSLDFMKALKNPQPTNEVLQCKDSQLKKPRWITADNIALLHKSSERWKLINYSISQDTSSDIYTSTEGALYDYAFSEQKQLIAITRSGKNGEPWLDLLKPNGEAVSSHLIKRPPEISKFTLIRPNFDYKNDQLFFSTGRQLFTLSYSGRVNKLDVPLTDPMILPTFHPDGNRILMIKGPIDRDIVAIERDQLGENTSLAGQTLARTNLSESNAQFQPNGNLIAFWSGRSGEPQIWLSHADGSNAKQLTTFPLDTQTSGFDWAADGNSLLVNANRVLTQIDLDSQHQTFPAEHPVLMLFQWDSKKNVALVLMQIEGIIRLVKYDLFNSKITVLTDKPVLWALKTEDDRLIYKDLLDQYWQSGSIEPVLIQAIRQLGNKSKSFLLHRNVVYAINTENKIWSYDLNNNKFNLLGSVNDDVNGLSDINDTHILMTTEVSAKKEVAELQLQ